MAEKESRCESREAEGGPVENTAEVLSALTASQFTIPGEEYARMRQRAEWEDVSKTSKLQVSGRLPEAD
jgi:hypothetical protein